MNNNWHKKEKPLLGLTGLGGGVDGLAVVGAATKIYGDELFSSEAYIGNESTRSITNGLDLSTEGGLVWTKCRSGSSSMHHMLFDTVRGVTKDLISSAAGAQGTSTTMVTAFNENGYTLGNSGYVNENNSTFSSWSFREAPGFFDIVNYTGNGTSQTISHDLGSIPGVIMIKNLSNATNWVVYHCHGGIAQAVDGDYAYFTRLNTTAAEYNSTNTITGRPTASSFSVGDNSDVNQNSDSYIAYIFAGGVSTAATAKSIDVDSGDYLSIPDDDAWELGDTFTIEAWIRPDNLDNAYHVIVAQDNSWYFSVLGGGGGNHGKLQFSGHSVTITTPFQHQIEEGAWTHVAFVSNSGSGQWYVNGTATGAPTSSVNMGSSSGTLYIGSQTSSAWPWDGRISNLRIVKGTAVYTSSFKVPTEPLSNITNTVLLCCQSSTVTTATVSPGTITNSGVVASIWNPFDDSEGFKFGEGGDQNMIKTGRYLGRGTTLNPEIHCGWEPQFIMIKKLTNTAPWLMYDCIRGVYGEDDSPYLAADSNAAEVTSTSFITLTPTGFHLNDDYGYVNDANETYSYIAIRRADGWVSKPASAGTDVFAMDLGNASSTIPTFDSGFPVDYAIVRQFASTDNWGNYSRLTGDSYLRLNTTDSQGTYSGGKWDSNLGWAATNYWDSNRLSWMWKRGPGFDVVAYEGNSQNSRIIRHSLGAAPDMMWIKNRDDTTDWIVGHIGLDGGNEPWTHYLKLNTYDAEGDYDYFMDKAPTAYSFEVTTGAVNDTNKSYLALLFKSITGISKVGSFTPDSSGSFTVTLGFTPRFMVLKPRTFSDNNWGWWVYDSQRGLTSGLTNRLTLESTAAQISGSTNGTTATGINFTGWGDQSSNNWVYYAHA